MSRVIHVDGSASAPMVYLDAAASTPLAPEAISAMTAAFQDAHGNPSSGHWAGRRAQELVTAARSYVADLVHRPANSVVFTSGATESNNLAIQGLLAGAVPGRRGIVTCVTEHPAVLNPLRDLQQQGVPVHVVAVDRDGRLDVDELAAAVDEQTLLVTVMGANNETGVLADVETIARIVHDAGAFFHCDASQLLTWGPLPEDHEMDLVTVSGHKMHGPQGVGALVLSRAAAAQLRPLQLGGGQERGLRSGTTNVAGVVGLGVAAELALREGPVAAIDTARRRDRLLEGLRAELQHVTLNGHPFHRSPGILNVAFGERGDGVDAEAILANMPTVAASSGSACSAGAPGPSPVLLAMGMSPERAASSLRFGLSRMTSDADIEAAIPLVVRAVSNVSGSCKSDATFDDGILVNAR